MKKILSLLLVFSLSLLAIIPMNITVLAADIGNDSFATQISNLKKVYRHGEYWNSYNACGYEGTGMSVCPNCNGKGYCAGDCPDQCGQFYYNGSWVSGQCLGWACKIGNSIFGGNPLAWSKKYDAYSIKPGDILYGNVTPIISGASTHGIFITNVSGNTVTYADCNAIGPCKVRWDATTTLDKIATSISYGATIYHASNNMTTGDVTPTPSPVYENIAEGTYYFKNNYNQKYIHVPEAKDAQEVNILTYQFCNSDADNIKVIKDGNYYKLQPRCSTTRVINPHAWTVTSGVNINLYDDLSSDSSQRWYFEKVSGGYVIRNAQNTSCVLTVDDSNNLYVATYTGAASQIWTIENSVSYDANGGTGAPGMQMKTYGAALTLSTTKPTRSGYVFLGWSTSSSATSATYSAGSSFTSNANTTLYAVWHKHTPGSSATCTSNQTCTTCGEILAYAYGHNPGSSATCTSNQICSTCGEVLAYAYGHNPGASATCTSNQTCTTCGEVLAYAYGHNPGASATCTSNQTCTTCGEILAYAYGHTEGDWVTLENGSKELRCAVCGELLATQAIPTYTVSYNANGGTGAPNSQKKTYNVTLGLSSVKPTRSGYTFLGWSTSSTATSATYSSGAAFTANKDTVLYAVWGENAKITTQPVSVTVEEGKTARVTVSATGDGIRYIWYYKNKGDTSFTKTTSFTGPTYSISMNDARNGRQVYCVVKDQYGNYVKSNVVTLSMQKVAKITTQPVSVTVASGATAKITVKATGDGIRYIWYFKNKGDTSFTKTTSFTGPTYSISMNDARNGRQVYCVVKDQYGNYVKSNVVTLSMSTPVKITTQPVSVTVAEGATAKVTLKASGDGIRYIWYFKNKGASSFTKTTSFTGPTYSIAMNSARDGRQVYCVVKDKNGKYVKSNVVTLSMGNSVKITGVSVSNGSTSKVTVNATGEGLTYTWYFKNKGASSFAKTTSFTGKTYSIAMNESRDGRQVYCVVTDKYGNSVKTSVVTLNMY